METKNAERLNQLMTLLYQGHTAQAERLAFEWVKTGVFTLADFSQFVRFCLNARPV